jgi:hypothetical protein
MYFRHMMLSFISNFYFSYVIYSCLMLFFLKYFCRFCVLTLPFIELARRLVVNELKHKMIEKIFLTKKTKSASASSFSELHVIGKEKIYSPTKLLEYLKYFLLFGVIEQQNCQTRQFWATNVMLPRMQYFLGIWSNNNNNYRLINFVTYCLSIQIFPRKFIIYNIQIID